MLDRLPISIESTMTATSLFCFATAGFLVGRKFCLAAGYKIGGSVASLLKKQNVAEWNKTSLDYWKMAQTDTIRDLTAAAGFIALGVTSEITKNILSFKETQEDQQKILNEGPLKQESNTLYNYSVGLLLTGTFTGWIFRKNIFDYLNNAIEDHSRLLGLKIRNLRLRFDTELLVANRYILQEERKWLQGQENLCLKIADVVHKFEKMI